MSATYIDATYCKTIEELNSLHIDDNARTALAALSDKLHQTLLDNRLHGIGGIVPSEGYYKHLWNWDTVFIAEGISYIDWQTACKQFRALRQGQWQGGSNDGFIPHIQFLDRPGYYPDRDQWDIAKVSGIDAATSAITQVPIYASGVVNTAQNAPSEDERISLFKENYDAICRYHHWLKTQRDPHDEGLIFAANPWETGTDNSPQFDVVLDESMPKEHIPLHVIENVDTNRKDNIAIAAGERPKQTFYYQIMHLVDLYNQWQHNQHKIFKRSPFVVQEVFFNCAWLQANRDAATIAATLGNTTQATQFTEWAKQTQTAMNEKLWNKDEGTYLSYDVRGKRFLPGQVINNLIPLWADIANTEQTQQMLWHLFAPDEFWTDYPIATASKQNSAHCDNYWRGRTWLNTNDLLVQALARIAQQPEFAARKEELLHKKDQLVLQTLQLLAKHGPSETYNCDDGSPGTLRDFGWSASIGIKYIAQITS